MRDTEPEERTRTWHTKSVRMPKTLPNSVCTSTILSGSDKIKIDNFITQKFPRRDSKETSETSLPLRDNRLEYTMKEGEISVNKIKQPSYLMKGTM